MAPTTPVGGEGAELRSPASVEIVFATQTVLPYTFYTPSLHERNAWGSMLTLVLVVLLRKDES